METRTTVRPVTFRKPFLLAALGHPQAAGTYTVRTEQEMLDTAVSLGWRVTSVTLEIFRDGAVEHIGVDAQELREALVRDGNPDLPFSSTPPDRSRRARDLMRRGGRR